MRDRRPVSLVLPLALLVAMPGCGGGPTPPRSLDEARAKRALTDALNAWKAGRPHDDPSGSGPPIRVADEDWLAGSKLLDFRVEPGDRVIGTRLSCPVTLILAGPGGRRVEKRVSYAVGTDPGPSVIRQDGR